MKVNLTSDNNNFKIEITDTGNGIPKENQSKVFTPFFTTKSMGKGTGLGLAISYGIIKMHKGNITFASEIGKGTTFKVVIAETSRHINQTKQMKERKLYEYEKENTFSR